MQHQEENKKKGNTFIGPNGILPTEEAQKYHELAANLRRREHNMSEMLANVDGDKEKLHDMLDAMWSCYIANYFGTFNDAAQVSKFNDFYIYLNRHIRAAQITVEEKDIDYRY